MLRAAIAVMAILAVALAASRSGSNEYAGVVSIENAREYRDAALIAKAWALPVAAAYRTGPFDYQRNQSFCGPASVVNVQRSLGRKQTQDDVLNGTGIATIFGHTYFGLTLDEQADLLRKKTGLPVNVLRSIGLEAFRTEMAHANDPTRRYVINFHRGPLFGRGHGHHSPILGYLAAQDLVFVGDVNRDFGGAWLVDTARLYEAMDTTDGTSGEKRGLIAIDIR
jgi:hypothetical protein